MHPNAEWPDATFSRGVWNVGSATCQSPRSVFGALVDKHHLSQRPSLTAASPRTQVWGPFFHVTSESQSWPGIPVCQLLAWFLTPRLPVRQHQVQRLPNKWQGWLGQDLGWMEAWDQDPIFFMPMG